MLMRAFSSGRHRPHRHRSGLQRRACLRKPEARNAATTLVWMGVILGSLFFGTAVLAHHLKPVPQEGGETVL